MKNPEAGWYIFIGITVIAGPFDSEVEACESLSPENRKAWRFELGSGTLEERKAAFLAMPMEHFDVCYQPNGVL